MHAVQFDKGPFIQVYSVMSVLPWQKMFNVGIMGALGWLGYENWQLKKKTFPLSFKPELYLLKDAADKTYINQKQAQEFATTRQLTEVGNLCMPKSEGLTKTDAATTYLPQTATKYFVQKTKEENDNLAQTVVSLALPVFNKQFVNINTFNTLKDTLATKEEVAKLDQKFITRTEFADVMTSHNRDIGVIQEQLKQCTVEQKNGFEKTETHFAQLTESLTKISGDMSSSFATVHNAINGLSSNPTFLDAVIENITPDESEPTHTNQTAEHDGQHDNQPETNSNG